ncbi:MAG: MBL fold metallo-hydrolase [Kineosporiaceae bacterium]
MTLPEPEPDAVAARPPMRLTFVGNATVLVRLGPFTLLTDPNFLRAGQRAYLGRGLWTRRLLDPALGVDDLPPLDAVVLSHLHGDHFDRVARRGLDHEVPLLTTEHAASRLSRQGFAAATALPTWQSTQVVARSGDAPRARLRVTSLPAVHARGVLGRVLPPVMGSLLEYEPAPGAPTTRVYLSGDTLTGDHLDEITARVGRPDVAVLHLGGTRVLARTVTMDAVQGVDAVRRLQPHAVMPVHTDDYRAFRSGLGAFEAEAERAGLTWLVRPVVRGSDLDIESVETRMNSAD